MWTTVIMEEQKQDFSDSMYLRPSSQRSSQLISSLSSISKRIATAKTQNNITRPVRLVAVSKLKPISDIIALASPEDSSNAHHHFGENYVQELVEKSRLLPPELQGKVRWHFIGGLQSNKAQNLARDVRGLWAVESVDSVKKANLLNKGRAELLDQLKAGEGEKADEEESQLRIFVQINTSGEESKSGLEPRSQDALELCRHIRSDKCPNLRLQGLMTIGAIARSKASTSENENEDFKCLKQSRDWVAGELSESDEKLELSMGMSEDFETAICLGSDEVRVGSTIFGERPPKSEARVLPPSDQEHTP